MRIFGVIIELCVGCVVFDTFKEAKYVSSFKFCLLISACVILLSFFGCDEEEAAKNAPAKDFIKISFQINEMEIATDDKKGTLTAAIPQTVAWLEDENGKYVTSVLVSEWLSYGGYKRPTVCVTWSGLADWANVSTEEFDTVTQATPYYGDNELVIDCTKRGLLPGTYYYCVETSVVDEYNILYRGQIKIGGKNNENVAEVKYIPDKFPLGENRLCDVKARYYR